ncbi:MAG: MFS transporter [Lachnospiraceae bacterium]|nr:MFS transporter [Lachnospiraceae bacterium]
MEGKLFTRDFTLVVIGQIISLFGNAAIRFALPLYLLNQTGSSALYGAVTACAFVPAILLSPVGGIVADRVNKRNIMVALDFFTAGVITVFSLLYGTGNLVLLITVTLMLLYGIAGAYQPSVQASIPALVSREKFMSANSVVNIINSFSALLGPVLGGLLYSAYGLGPVLWVSILCFVLSAVMELFIRIPFTKREIAESMWKTVKDDFGESIRFIRREEPVIGKGLLMVCGINLFLSAMLTVGLPYIVTEVLPLDQTLAKRLCGYAEGALAAGGLTGGICAGIFAEKLEIRKAGNLIIGCTVCVFPMGMTMLLSSSAMVNYLVMVVSCFFIMVCSTVFAVQMISFVQAETPADLIGKVIAVMLTVSMCAQPLGNVMYGFLFAACRGYEFAVILFAGAASLLIALAARKGLKRLGQQ